MHRGRDVVPPMPPGTNMREVATTVNSPLARSAVRNSWEGLIERMYSWWSKGWRWGRLWLRFSFEVVFKRPFDDEIDYHKPDCVSNQAADYRQYCPPLNQ